MNRIIVLVSNIDYDYYIDKQMRRDYNLESGCTSRTRADRHL